VLFFPITGASGCIGGKQVQPTCIFGGLLHQLRLNAPRTAVLAVFETDLGPAGAEIAKM
jgi:hypothetical protein